MPFPFFNDLPFAGEILAVLSALFFAIAVVIWRKLTETGNAISLNFFKNNLALALLSLTLIFSRQSLPTLSASQLLLLCLSGILGAMVGDLLFFHTLRQLGASRTAIVTTAYAPMTALLAIVVLREPFTLTTLSGLSLVITGIAVAIWEPTSRQPAFAHNEQARLKGTLLGTTSVLAMGCSIIIIKPFLNQVGATWALEIRLAAANIALFIYAQVRSVSLNSAGENSWLRKHWGLAAVSVIFGNFLALLCWVEGMRLTSVSIASALNQLSTLFICLLATLFLRERFTIRLALGLLLGLCGASLFFVT